MLIIILILKPDLDVTDVKFDMPYNVRVTTRHTTNEYGEITRHGHQLWDMTPHKPLSFRDI